MDNEEVKYDTDAHAATRHSELLFWSTVEEAWDKRYSVKRFKGFRIQSDLEAFAWDSPDFASSSIAFYAFLDQMQALLTQSAAIGNAKSAFSGSQFKKKLSFMLASASIGTIAGDLLEAPIKRIAEAGAPGAADLQAFLKISRRFSDHFCSQVKFSDPDFFSNDVFWATEKILSADSYRKAQEYYRDTETILNNLYSSGFFDLFFDFGKSLRGMFLPHKPASELSRQILFFNNGAAWCSGDTFENSFFFLIFGADSPLASDLFFIETARLYYRNSESDIAHLRKILFRRVFQEFMTGGHLFANAMAAFASKSIEVAREEEIYDFYAASFNSYIIDKNRDKIAQIAAAELDEIQSGNAFSNIDLAAKAHSAAFVNILEKTVAFLSSSKTASLLPVSSANARSKNIEDLAAVVREVYINSASGEQK